MTTQEKLQALDYYLGDKCRCGQSKKSKRWVCLDCRAVRNPELTEKLDKACIEHVEASMRYVADCVSRRIESPNG